MASGAVSAAIEDHLTANWSTTPLLFENKDADESGNALPPATPGYFVEVSFTGKSYGQQSIGASLQADNRWDEEGFLFLNVMIPKGWGSRDGRTYAKSLCDLFRGVTLLSGNLEFLDASIGEGEKGKYDGNYFLLPVDIEWRRVSA